MTIFANIYFDWMPAWTDREFAILVAVCAAVWVLLRLFWGKSLVSGRAGLVALRCCTLGIVAAILAGPTIIDEQDGEVTRPSMLVRSGWFAEHAVGTDGISLGSCVTIPE